MKYEVPVIYRGQCSFIVEARNPLEARMRAEQAFRQGVEPDRFGNEWEKPEKIGEALLLEMDTADSDI